MGKRKDITITKPIGSLLADTENKEAYYHLSQHFDDTIPYIGTGLSLFYLSWGAPFKSILDGIKAYPMGFDENGNAILSAEKDCFFDPLSEEDIARIREKVISKEVLSLDEKAPFTIGTCIRDYLRYAVDSMNRNLEDAEKMTIRFPKKGKGEGSKAIWRIFDNLYVKGRFLELGELLNITSLAICGESFNERFFSTIENKKIEAVAQKENELSLIGALNALNNKEKLPPARWFLPYLGSNVKIAFTTNTDESMEWVFEEILDNAPVRYSAKHSSDEIKRTANGRGNTRVIYHIHGFQPGGNTNTADTFIMTWSDYKKNYHECEGSPLPMLIDYFRNHYFFFIGASLEKDTTVELMKKITRQDSTMSRHVAIFKYPDGKMKEQAYRNKRSCLKKDMATQTMTVSKFEYYPIILCHLVRENRMSEWAVFKNILENKVEADEQFTESITSFLKKKEPFLVYDSELNETELSSKLYPALKTVISNKGIRLFNWSVCNINSESFCFPIRATSKAYEIDTYSAPLGNTIYILGGKNMTLTKRDNILDDIKKWTENHEDAYWSELVKVRVICVKVTGDYPPEILKPRLEELLNLDRAEAATQLWKLLSQLSQIQTYVYYLLPPGFLKLARIDEKDVYTLINLLLSAVDFSLLSNSVLSQLNDDLTNIKRLVLKP